MVFNILSSAAALSLLMLFFACPARAAGNKDTLLSERKLPMRGGYNYRDLGGLKTKDGRTVQRGKIFRTDDLAHLTPEDLACLQAIPVTTVIDFRTENEVAKAPDKLPASVTRALHFPISPGRLDGEGLFKAKVTLETTMQFMHQLYEMFVNDDEIIAVYKRFMREVENAESLPLLFHCSAGKDRTGYAAALILFSLGVDKETVLKDYMDSATCLEGKYTKWIAEDPAKAPLFEVHTSYLQAAIDAMEKKSGSIDAYLDTVLQVDRKKLREMLLQPE